MSKRILGKLNLHVPVFLPAVQVLTALAIDIRNRILPNCTDYHVHSIIRIALSNKLKTAAPLRDDIAGETGVSAADTRDSNNTDRSLLNDSRKTLRNSLLRL